MYLVSLYLHWKPDQLNFCANQYGKPALHDHELEFNLSHSGDFSLIAITRERKVGVDVERLRQGVSSQLIAEQYFSGAGGRAPALPLSQRGVAFFTCWTLKEAYIKAQGLGLSWPLERFDVSLTPERTSSPSGNPAQIRKKRLVGLCCLWRLILLTNQQSLLRVRASEFRLWDLNTR